MKFKVIKNFRDKLTGEKFEVNSIYETNDKKRVKELKGYIGEEIKEKKKADKK